LPGLIRQDNSDPQYRSFRSNLSALSILALSYLGCSAIYPKLVNDSVYPRTIFIAAFSIIMLVILHGSSTIKILLILGINYRLAKMEKKKMGLLDRYWPGLVIVGNMLVLFLNERNDGYRFSHLHSTFEVVVSQSMLQAFQTEADCSRTASKVCCHAGISTSTSQCYGSYLLPWIITGDNRPVTIRL
jgi:hypothetical protein